MEIKYFFQNVTLTTQQRDLIEGKIQKFARLTDKIWEAKVDLSYNPGHGKRHGRKEIFRMEINLRMPNKILRGVERAPDFQTALDNVGQKLIRQLRKYKTFGEIRKKKTAKIIRRAKSI